jgi:hypothetical protein
LLRAACGAWSAGAAALAALAAAWTLLHAAPPAGVWGGSVWLSGNVSFPAAAPSVPLCFAMTSYAVPARATSYSCRAFAFPPGVALHATAFEPIVDRADVLHHMILYATDRDYSALGDARGVFDCASMPRVSGPVFVWAVGAPRFALPPTVGIPVAANLGAVAGVAYAILQVHYSNPGALPDVVDSSGLVVSATAARRPIDAGIVELGASVGSIAIPANRAAYGIAGTCAGATTAGLPPARQLNALTPDYVVLASALHAHTLGRRLWTEQWRGGMRVRATDGSGADPLGSSPFYSFANQRFAPAPGGGAVLRPGDTLVTRGVYENTRAAGAAGGNAAAAAGRPVVGCEATTCEMLFNFLVMYPRAPGTTSLSCAPSAVPFCEDLGADSGGAPASGLPSCAAFAS